jgi:site-specific recombinase XerD
MMKTQTKLQKGTRTILKEACEKVEGFQKVIEAMEEKMLLADLSPSTTTNYTRSLAQLSLFFSKLPQDISENEVNKYLMDLARKPNELSRSSFKLLVYSLRYYYRLIGITDRVVQLPVIKHKTKLPVVLNYAECKALFRGPTSLRDRILLVVMYSCGLRTGEVSRLKIQDIDSGRMMIHVHQSKGRKDRYVPISPLILPPLREYYKIYRPVNYLFNGCKSGFPLSRQGIQSIFQAAVKKCNILKRVSPHTLRHTYATHLLEFGMDIVTIKELLGHERIETTMVYLHVAMLNRSNLFSPFDRLYQKP